MMKRYAYILLVLVLLPADNTAAQTYTRKNMFSLSGGISYTSTLYEGDNSKSESFIFNPAIYYFVRDRISIGLSTHCESSKSAEFKIGNDRSGYDMYGIGPSARFYLGNSRLLPFMSAGYFFSNIKYAGTDKTAPSHDINFGFGFDYFLSSNLAFELSANFHRMKLKTADYSFKDNTYHVNLSDAISSSRTNIMLGIFVYIY